MIAQVRVVNLSQDPSASMLCFTLHTWRVGRTGAAQQKRPKKAGQNCFGTQSSKVYYHEDIHCLHPKRNRNSEMLEIIWRPILAMKF